MQGKKNRIIMHFVAMAQTQHHPLTHSCSLVQLYKTDGSPLNRWLMYTLILFLIGLPFLNKYVRTFLSCDWLASTSSNHRMAV